MKEQMRLETTLSQVLALPTPDVLWNLRADLLTLADRLPPGRWEEADWTLEIVREFHGYLAELRSKMTAREYSQLASRMDTGSVGMLALQDLVTEREHLLESLFLGGLSEGLMVLATLQYVKAWEAETALVHDQAIWWLSLKGCGGSPGNFAPRWRRMSDGSWQMPCWPRPARRRPIRPSGWRCWCGSFRYCCSAA
jgi:hypothetical protein